AAVVADPLDHGGRARVAHREALARPPCAVQLAAGRPVQDGVAGEHRVAGVAVRRADDDPAAAHRLADVVVRLAGQVERDAGGEERAEALAGRALEAGAHPSGRLLRAEATADRPAEPGTHRPVPGRDRVGRLDERGAVERGLRRAGQALAELASARDGELLAVAAPAGTLQQRREVERIRTRIARLAPAQEVDAADRL